MTVMNPINTNVCDLEKSRVDEKTSSFPEFFATQKELKSKLVSNYWISQPHCNGIQQPPISDCSSSNIGYVLSEYQMIRETVWMLLGYLDPTSHSYLYYFSKDEIYVVHENVIVSHLTSQSCQSCLAQFASLGTLLYFIRNFIKSININSCLTYQAFSSCITSVLNEFQAFLITQEKSMIAHETSWTLLSLNESLYMWNSKISCICSLISEGIPENAVENCVRSATLLSVITNACLSTNLKHISHEMDLLLKILCETSEPYLNIIDYWLLYGVLKDPKEDFIVKKSQHSIVEDWDQTFHLNCTADLNYMSDLKLFVPNFLMEVKAQIVIAGKSRELLQDMKVLNKLDKINVGEDAPISLHQSLVSNLLSLFEDPSQFDKLYERNSIMPSATLTRSPGHEAANFSLVRQNLENLVPDLHPTSEDSSTFSRIKECDSKFSTSSSLYSFSERIRCGLIPPIQQIYFAVGPMVLETMREKFNLCYHIQIIRRYFLMEAGESMNQFNINLFKMMINGDNWGNMSALNMWMNEAVSLSHAEEADHLWVEINNNDQVIFDQPDISKLENLSLHYKMPWPVQLVINEENLAQYSSIFSFLLQIKMGKYFVETLSYRDLLVSMDADKGEMCHKMFLLRQKLMHFINNLHDYILTRILHSTGVEFSAAMEKITDYKKLAELHSEHVAKLQWLCILDKNTKFLLQPILTILQLAVTFSQCWNNGISILSDKKLDEMSLELIKSIRFFTLFLRSVIKKDWNLHLECLLSGLVNYDLSELG